MLEKRLGTVLSGQIEWACANADSLSAQEMAFRIHLFAFEHVQSLPHIAHAMLSGAAGQNALSSFLEQIIAMREALPKPPETYGPPEVQHFVACYHAGSIVSVLLKWVEADCTPDATTMARFMAQMANKQCDQ
ncbi:TetR-like C-terminal domain-containing protein [Neptunicoccus cionae]|uniref:TetR-like C-terminal domain-containing protein n=1 Tax=Neptunicoccus cionae TaxID=2035344 RepID=UPI00257128ED|nr:TetR-like C-terminal domain-containing protein [Amylibacter cionae]